MPESKYSVAPASSPGSRSRPAPVLPAAAPSFLMPPRLAPRPMQSPEVVFGIWREEFLGFHEWGGLFTLTCHPQVIGHPSRLRMLRRLIRVVKRHRGVWWATASEVAAHWLPPGRRGGGASRTRGAARDGSGGSRRRSRPAGRAWRRARRARGAARRRA